MWNQNKRIRFSFTVGEVGLAQSRVESEFYNDDVGKVMEAGKRSFVKPLLESSLFLDLMDNGEWMRVFTFCSLCLPVCWLREEVLW